MISSGPGVSSSDYKSFETAFESTDFDKDRINFDLETGKPSTDTDAAKFYQITTDKYFCEVFPDYKNGSNCTGAVAWKCPVRSGV